MKRILRNSKENFLKDPGRNLSRNFTWERNVYKKKYTYAYGYLRKY